MSEERPEKRQGDRRQGADPEYQGEERRKGDRRTKPEVPKPG